MQVFVARQPIFTRRLKVFGYELLYRSGFNNYYDATNGEDATSTVITNSFTVIGIDALTERKKAFINFSSELLRQEVPLLLPKERVAIEILESVEPTPEIIAACKKMKEMGYLLVLDDFIFNKKYIPLLELAMIVKVDWMTTGPVERASLIKYFAPRGIEFLAERVETREEFQEAYDLGYTYFQGYFFSKPAIISGHDIPDYKLNYLRLLHEVHQPQPDLDLIERIIKLDLSISYKLLRLINSAAYGFHSRIGSIRQAIVLLGFKEFSKWVSLMVMRGMSSDKPDELIVDSVVRARFGELLAQQMGMENRSSDVFLMGLFSMLDAFLDLPMQDALKDLPIADEIKEALLGVPSVFRRILELIIAYEKVDWDRFEKLVGELSLDANTVPEVYSNALTWTGQIYERTG